MYICIYIYIYIHIDELALFIWGFDCNLTNYTFKSNFNFGISLEVHPSGKICILQIQWFLWNSSLWNYIQIPIWIIVKRKGCTFKQAGRLF